MLPISLHQKTTKCHRLTVVCSDQGAGCQSLVLLLVPFDPAQREIAVVFCFASRFFEIQVVVSLPLSSFLRTVLPSEINQGTSLHLKLHVSSCVYAAGGVYGLVCESCVRLDDASTFSKMPPFPFVVYSLAALLRPSMPQNQNITLINPVNGKLIFRIPARVCTWSCNGSRAIAGAQAALLSISCFFFPRVLYSGSTALSCDEFVCLSVHHFYSGPHNLFYK